MDLAAIERELEELRKEKIETKQRLDAQRGPLGGPGPASFIKDRPVGNDLRVPPPPFAPAAGARVARDRDVAPRDGYGYGGRDVNRGGVVQGRMMGGVGPRSRMEGPGSGPAAGGWMGMREPAGPPGGMMMGAGRRGLRDAPSLPPPMGSEAVMGPPPPRRGRPPSDHDDRDRGLRFNNGGLPIRGSRDDVPMEVPPAPAPRKRLVSSVVVKDDRASAEPESPGSARGTKRGAPEGEGGGEGGANGDEGAAGGARKRNRRMFGALLGTLAKFSEEDAKFRASDVATRRMEAQRKAEERERQRSEELRRREIEARQERREEELSKLSEISLATDTKLLELMFMKRIARKQALSNFLCTKSHPPLYWMPAMPCPATDKLLEEQKLKFEEWKIATLEELEVEKEALRKRSEERRAAALARRAERLAARQGRAGAPAAGAAGGAKGDEEDEADMAEQRELEAGEYAGHEEQQQQQQQQQEEHVGPEAMDCEEKGQRQEGAEANPGQQQQQQQQQQPQPRKQQATPQGRGSRSSGGAEVEEGERVVPKKGSSRGGAAEAADAQDGRKGGAMEVDADDRYQGGHEHGEEEEEEGERPGAAEEGEHKGEAQREGGQRRGGEADEEREYDLEEMEGLRDKEAATVEDLLS
uniref:Pinin/SDK/MemA protein domain-containing protein n=1 Tax=Dunaliella tertiolecta TaxID=3047 RepID=A0A7S3QNY5_DUNTE